MNDSSSSLAITEKRPQRSGGCVGIFFQLLEWNRKLAKKKLFSKKLLPAARAKKASEKFGADDKLPKAKLLLIADENRGGFPKKSEHDNGDYSNAERNHEMKSPGLVARLMGLESMPAVRSKPKKLLFTEYSSNTNPCYERRTGDDQDVGSSEEFGCSQEESQFEKGQMKVESRPQKLQKTGMFERRAVTRFGAEALQFKSVLSRSRKHHPKLGSPVKSPRVGRNSTRLMDVATKILEPGLHATQRAKCTLTYAPSAGLCHEDGHMRVGKPFVEFDQSDPSNYYASASKSVKGQPSCKSCGNWLDVVDRRQNLVEKMPEHAKPLSDFGTIPSSGSGRSRMKPFVSSMVQERNVDAPISQERCVSFRAESRVSIQRRTKSFTERKPAFRDNLDQYSFSSQRTKPPKDIASVTPVKQRTPRPSRMPLDKNRGSPSTKFENMNCQRVLFNVGSVNGAKDFVSSNRNAISKTKPRMPFKITDTGNNDIERNAWDKRDDSPSKLRAVAGKRRPINSAAQVENTKLTQPHPRKQRDVRGDEIIGKVVGSSSAYCKNQNRVKTELTRQKLPKETKGDSTGCRKDVDVISFTFSSPMKHNSEPSSPSIDQKGSRGKVMNSGASMSKKLTYESNSGKPSSHMATQLRGDALGALLEEKLRELTCQNGEELETREVQGRSTASILEELISALNAERPSTLEDGDNCSVSFSQDESYCHDSQDNLDDISPHRQMLNASKIPQGEAKSHGVLGKYPHTGNCEQPSPGSVLDATFSNDSCFSESLDGCSGYKLHPESIECSYDHQQPSELDADFSDSATSLSTGRSLGDKSKYSLNNISSALYGIDPADMGLVGCEINHAWEVIGNAELVIGSLSGGHSLVKFCVGSLLDKLETLSDAVWLSPRCSMGFNDAKDGSQLKRFLFNCIIECLDSKYNKYCRSRFTAWPKLPLQINGEFLIQEVHKEVQSWVNLAGKRTVEILDREASLSFGGMEYVLHHLLSIIAVAYALLYGEGQLYTYMVLISETTTLGINLRWYLDTAGIKRSNAYLVNGVVMFSNMDAHFVSFLFQ